MENFPSSGEVENVIRELSGGREQAMQLQHLLDMRSSTDENCDHLVRKILHSYDQALSMLGNRRPEGLPPPANSNQDSPRSAATDDSDQADLNKDQTYGRRMAAAKWTQKVKVSLEMGIEGQLADGCNWRKYGQKDILGAKYPRGYYRCTHRHGQGCLATKQVQRSDEDPTVFEITYRLEHTCNPRANPNNNNPPSTQPGPQYEDPNQSIQNPLHLVEGPSSTQQNLGSNEGPFYINPENDPIFSDCDNILGNYSNNNLLSTATSGSGYFSNAGGFGQNLQNTDCELTPIVASVTSASSSSAFGSNFPFESSGFGSGFSYGDHPGYYYP